MFGEFGNNFVYTMQRLAENHPKLTVVNDLLGQSTWPRTLAEFMLHLIAVEATYGIYHLSNHKTATWFDFAKEILKDTAVEGRTSDKCSLSAKAYRPKHSVMSLEKAKSTEFEIPSWREALKEFYITRRSLIALNNKILLTLEVEIVLDGDVFHLFDLF
ncbi:SDR family oxidoreductase [Leuconostoc lactis]|uniref:SDR family oxidoreductase n=1 Tax=Leuconostoc lactis TaxID=1246 RepID=UPI0035CE9FFA